MHVAVHVSLQNRARPELMMERMSVPRRGRRKTPRGKTNRRAPLGEPRKGLSQTSRAGRHPPASAHDQRCADRRSGGVQPAGQLAIRDLAGTIRKGMMPAFLGSVASCYSHVVRRLRNHGGGSAQPSSAVASLARLHRSIPKGCLYFHVSRTRYHMNRDSSSRESQILRLLAGRVAALLEARGESQKSFAGRIGVNYVKFNNWMRGEVAFPSGRLPAIADGLSVSIDELFGRTNDDSRIRTRLRKIQQLAKAIETQAAQ